MRERAFVYARAALWCASALALALPGCGRDVTTIGAEPNARHDAGGRDAPLDASTTLDAGLDASMPLDASADASDPLTAATTVDGSVYLEAEDGELSAFTLEDAPLASGAQALVAPEAFSDAMPGDARARYRFELADAGEYLIWGRVYAPDIDSNRFWLRLDEQPWLLWRISTGEVWYWDDIHDDAEYGTPLVFTLAAGVHTLVFANAGPRARLDRIYITARGDQPEPANDTPCRPPHTVELDGACVPSCGLLMGTRCGPVDCMGQEALPAYDCDICCRVE